MFGLFNNESLQKKIIKTFADKLAADGVKQIIITLKDDGEIEILKVEPEMIITILKPDEQPVNILRYNYLLKFFTEHKSLLN